MSKEQEKTTYSDYYHIDLINARGEECAMVAHDSPSSEDLYNSISDFLQTHFYFNLVLRIGYDPCKDILKLNALQSYS